jgi:probable rRNA maturation factor
VPPPQELESGRHVLEIEVIGIEGIAVDVPVTDELRFPTAGELKGLCALAISSAGIDDGHVAIEFVDAERIRELNREHRQIDQPTDVLSFGVDGDGESAGPRELGDIVICPEHTVDLREAVIHGALHLTGMDHESDDGEMLALQAELLRWAR